MKAAARFSADYAAVELERLRGLRVALIGETIIDALGFEPDRPERVVGLEAREQRVQVLDNDADAVMNLIAKVTGVTRP